MAVLFPKKVPAFSRALGESDDVFDFDTDVLIPAEITVLSSVQVNDVIKTCIVGVGSAQCKALKDAINFSNTQLVKEFNLTLSNQVIMTCSAHKFAGGSLIWLCDSHQNESCYGYGKWTEAVLSSFKLDPNSRIFIFTDAPTSAFQSDSKPIAPFVRALRTPKAASECVDIKSLEPPNILSGFAAALMSRCICDSLPACVLIAYYDNIRASSTDQDIASVIIPILKSTTQLHPYILPIQKSAKITTPNFDQMYI